MWFQLIVLAVFVHQSYEAGVTMDTNKTPCACGSVNRTRTTRVVGGGETGVGEFPWMASIKQDSGTEKVDLCGGALVNTDYVLTASHCFASNPSINSLFVYLGDHDSTKTTESPSVIRSVRNLIRHPNYNTTSQANDIAIIKLVASVTFTWNIQPICIPSAAMYFFQQYLVITGWGATEAAGASSNVLMKVTLPVIPNAECKKKYAGTVAKIDDSTVCAGTPDGSKDACQGDSGGPAAWKCDSDGDYSLGCIVSYGIGCGNPNFPGVYTNVSHYLPWILQNIPGSTLCGSNCAPQPVSDCGWPNDPPRQKRVVGGWVTSPNQYPWMVSVYIYLASTNAWTFSCAATIISREYLMTSAKCVFNVSLANMFMVVGDYNINKLNEDGEKEVFPKKVIVHPSYNKPLLANDIALIQLTELLTFSYYVSPVCLPSSQAIKANFELMWLEFTGWGKTSTGGQYASQLKAANLWATSNTVCKSWYGNSTINENISVCTDGNSQGDVCDGDSGGPLMRRGQTGRVYQVALNSYRNSAGCGVGYPPLHTRIVPYLGWIESVSGVKAASTSDTL